jgi:hypothetical protein
MATQDDVRRIALSLPATSEDPKGFRFFVDGKQFVWSWLERPEPKRRRVPNPDVISGRVQDEIEKQSLLAVDPGVFFTNRTTMGTPPSWCGSPPLISTCLRTCWLRDGDRGRRGASSPTWTDEAVTDRRS